MPSPIRIASFILTGKWKKMRHIVDQRRFRGALEQNVKKATNHNAMIAVREVRKRIKGKQHTPNAALTVLIKKSSTPLVDDGDLFQAITYKEIDARSVFIGILRTARNSRNQSLYNIAGLLHEGGSIRVTEAMRGLFTVLAKVGQGKMDKNELTGRAAELAERLGNRIKKIRPLGVNTRAITIPPRPFIKPVLEDKALHAKFKRNWERALDAALKAGSPPPMKG